eukprot:jgi/Psemu1/33671/gm1.33671_g
MEVNDIGDFDDQNSWVALGRVTVIGRAIQTNTDEEPTVLIELTITDWRFKPNWNASLFNKIYEDQSVIIPSSPATSPSNASKDNVLPSSFRDLFIQAYTGDPPSTTAKLLPLQTSDSIVDMPAPNSNEITPSFGHVQPAEANVNMIVPSGTTGLVHTKTAVSNPVKTPSNSTAPNASRYTWTWTYSSEVSPKCKGHISMLLENSTVWYIDKDTTRRPVHDDQALATAANMAKLKYHQYQDPTIHLEFNIQHWGFRRGWYPYEFAKVYDKSRGTRASEAPKSLELLPTTTASYTNRVANILESSRGIISHENEFCFDLPDPHFE